MADGGCAPLPAACARPAATIGGISFGASQMPPAKVKWTPSGRRRTTPSTVPAYLPPGARRGVEVDDRVGPRVLSGDLADQLVEDCQPRRVVLGPRRPVGLFPFVRARRRQEHHVRPRGRHELRRLLQLLLHVGGVDRVQDVGPRALVLPVDHLPAPGQEHDHVGLDLVHGVLPLEGPRPIARGLAGLQHRPIAGWWRVASRAPMIWIGCPLTTPQPRIPLSERT